MNVKEKAALSIIINIMKGIINLSISIIIARSLITEDYGLLSLATTIVFLFIQFSDFGINDLVIKRLPIEKDKISFVKKAFILNLSFATISSILLVLLSNPLAHIYEKSSMEMILKIGALFIVPGSIYLLICRILEGLKKFQLTVWYGFLDSILKVIIIILLMVINKVNPMTLLLSFFMPQTIITSYILIKKGPLFKVDKAFLEFKRSFVLLNESLPYALVPILNYASNYINNLLIGLFLTMTDVGIYNISRFPYKVISLIAPVFSLILKPIFVSSRNNTKLIEKATNYIIMVSFPIGVLLFKYSNLIITILYGERYIDASILFKLASINIVQISIIQVLFSYFFAKVNPSKVLNYNIINLLVQSILSLIFIFIFKIYGVAISDLLVKTTLILLLIIYTKPKIKKDRLIKTVATITLSSSILYLNLFYNEIANAIFNIGCFLLALYFIMLDKEERKIINKLLNLHNIKRILKS